MDLHILLGPIVRQVVQWAAGGALATGVMMDNDIATIAGAVTSLINLGFVIKARIRAKG